MITSEGQVLETKLERAGVTDEDAKDRMITKANS